MSRLTVTEKEHWKQRIERRLDKAISAIEARHPELMPDIKTRAESKALDVLGVLKLHEQAQMLKKQSAQLSTEADQLQERIYETVLGKTTCSRLGRYSSQSQFDQMKRQQEVVFEEELLQSHDIGREILKLRAEREALLDTVWLATSSKHIRDLWSRVSKVLGEDSTPLQEEILCLEDETKS